MSGEALLYQVSKWQLWIHQSSCEGFQQWIILAYIWLPARLITSYESRSCAPCQQMERHSFTVVHLQIQVVTSVKSDKGSIPPGQSSGPYIAVLASRAQISGLRPKFSPLVPQPTNQLLIIVSRSKRGDRDIHRRHRVCLGQCDVDANVACELGPLRMMEQVRIDRLIH